MTTPEERYGATLDTVRGLVPAMRIGPDTRPSEEQVEGFLEVITGEVALVVEDLAARGYSVATVTRGRTYAKGLVALGAAAMAVDAAHPERTGRTASSYGEVLWDRYTNRLTNLVDLLDFDEDAGGDGEEPGGPATGSPAYSFPEPTMRRNTGF